MDGYLRQSTASQTVTVGPFVDDTDFKTAKNALTIANTDIKIKKNGAASASKNSGGATADGTNGMYHLTWDATDTATVGQLAYTIKVSGALVVFGTFLVLEEAVYDALFASSAPGYVADQAVNVTKFGGTTVTARDIGASVLLSSGSGTGQLDFTSGVVKANVTQFGGSAATTSGGRPEVNTSHIAGAAVSTSSAQIGVNVVNAAGTAWNSGAIGASTLAADTITDAKVASDVTIASVTGSVGSIATGGITSGSFAAGAIDNAAIAADAIGSSELAASAVTEIQSGLSTLDAAGVRSAVGLASANLDTQLSTIDDFLDTEVAAIKAKTDNLPASPAATGDIPSAASVADAVWDEALAGHATGGSAGAALSAASSGADPAAIADAVWDEAIADHQDAGSTGESLNGAGGAGNPWIAIAEGSYTFGDLVRIIAAVQSGKSTIVDAGGGAATVTFRDVTDASDIVVATMDGSERTSVTLNP